jgi:hypothetical protein
MSSKTKLTNMKRIFYTLILLALIGLSSKSNAQYTTISSGNWSNPTTWGGAPPIGSGTVTINHTVTLDMDYSHYSGSITINGSGFLIGNSSMRVFAMNYPSGTASLTNSGNFNVARVPFISGTIINSGILTADSLLNYATITNNVGANIYAAQFMIHVGGTLNNNGSSISTNFLTLSTVTNNGSLTSNDFTNSKDFTNSATGLINITSDFSNIDTTAGPAIFTNNGSVTVANDWHNGSQINGSGKFCIGANSWNSGQMTGTFDFCDQSGNDVDLNTGTIAGTITYCLFPCTVGINNNTHENKVILFPNPNNGLFSISINENYWNSEIVFYNYLGEKIYSSLLNPENSNFDFSNQSDGIYFYQIKLNSGNIVSGKFIKE